MKRFFKALVILLKDIWYVIKGMLSLRGLLSLFISFMIYQGWAYVFIILGPFIHSAWMTATGTAVILAWFGPGTPAIPLIVITALLIQRFIFRERNPRYDAFMKKYKGILNERKRRKIMKTCKTDQMASQINRERQMLGNDNTGLPINTPSENIRLPRDPFKTVTIRIYQYDYEVRYASAEEINKIVNKGKMVDNSTYLGACNTETQLIYLSKDMHPDKRIPVLIHEIMHAILEDTANDRKSYSAEDVCCLIEAHYREINSAVHMYKESMSI